MKKEAEKIGEVAIKHIKAERMKNESAEHILFMRRNKIKKGDEFLFMHSADIGKNEGGNNKNRVNILSGISPKGLMVLVKILFNELPTHLKLAFLEATHRDILLALPAPKKTKK